MTHAQKVIPHERNCGCEVGHVFVCAACQKMVGWCMGGSDDDEYLSELCCDCWVKETRRREKLAAVPA